MLLALFFLFSRKALRPCLKYQIQIQEDLMQTQSDLREFAHYALPNVLGMVGLSCYILADTFFVSLGMGSSGLAALNLAIPVYSFIHGSGLMLGMGGATRCAILNAQGDRQSSRQVYTHTLALGAALSVFFVLLGLFFSRKLTHLLGADADVFDMTHTYLRVLLLFAPLFIFNDMLLPFVRNAGAPRRAMCGQIGSSLSNIVLDYVFIFPLNMGIFGAVLATCIAPAISLAVLTPFLMRERGFFRPVRCPAQPQTALGVMALGFPSLVTEVAAGVVTIVFNTILLSLHGNLAVAAYGVVSNLALVVTAIYTGIAQGAQPLMSRCHGAAEHRRTLRLLRYALTTVLTLSAVIYAVIFFGAQPIAAVFNSEGDPQLQSMAVRGLRIYFTCCCFAGINVLLATFFTCVERSRPANAISLLRGLIVVIPAAFLLSRLGGLDGLWCTLTVTEALVACVGGWCFWNNKKSFR